MSFYSNEKILHTMDRDGNPPELIFCVSRGRSLGKTFAWTKSFYERWVNSGYKDKFVLFCRNKYELGSVAEGMFKSMLDFCYPGTRLFEKIQMKGVYSNIYCETSIDGEEAKPLHCGYVIPLNSSDNIKRVSSMFSDSVWAFFDEMQPEDKNSWLPNEVEKFLSIITSIARGDGQSRRFYQTIMCSNCVNITNPYFVAIEGGLHKKLQQSTKLYRGSGFVYERCENKDIAEEHKETGIAKAFSNERYVQFDDNSFLNDNYSCIAKPDNWGRSHYICTLISGKNRYAVKYYPQVKLYYVDFKIDKTCNQIFNIRFDNMEPNIPLIRGTLTMIKLREAMEHGLVRFKDLTCKDVCMDLFL